MKNKYIIETSNCFCIPIIFNYHIKAFFEFFQIRNIQYTLYMHDQIYKKPLTFYWKTGFLKIIYVQNKWPIKFSKSKFHPTQEFLTFNILMHIKSDLKVKRTIHYIFVFVVILLLLFLSARKCAGKFNFTQMPRKIS